MSQKMDSWIPLHLKSVEVKQAVVVKQAVAEKQCVEVRLPPPRRSR
jgi:hypothetical protein